MHLRHEPPRVVSSSLDDQIPWSKSCIHMAVGLYDSGRGGPDDRCDGIERDRQNTENVLLAAPLVVALR